MPRKALYLLMLLSAGACSGSGEDTEAEYTEANSVAFAVDHGVDEQTAHELYAKLSELWTPEEIPEFFNSTIEACVGPVSDLVTMLEMGNLVEDYVTVACGDTLKEARDAGVVGNLGNVETARDRVQDASRDWICADSGNARNPFCVESGPFRLFEGLEKAPPNNDDFYVSMVEAEQVSGELLRHDILGDFVLELGGDQVVRRAWLQYWSDQICVIAAEPDGTPESVETEILTLLAELGLPTPDYVDDLYLIARTAASVSCESELQDFGL
jgi:hypothetical protein